MALEMELGKTLGYYLMGYLLDVISYSLGLGFVRYEWMDE
jgi:hypothetical protein